MDNVSGAVRSKIMAAVPQRSTTPEKLVRRALRRLELRFRLNDRKLPGSPDIVVPRYRTAIFVHGCFWHRHGCSRTTSPRTREVFWSDKFKRNVERDRVNARELRALGWRVIVVWECSTADEVRLQRRLKRAFPTALNLVD
jgi:DNA mismatch endonuclease, patch repair protein